MTLSRILTTIKVVLLVAVLPAWAQYNAPSGYYDSATGTGETLKSQLCDIMSAGHAQQTYGDFRYDSAYYDEDSTHPGKIRLVYNGDFIDGEWDSGRTWNREHVWPQSRQPGSVNNSTRGNLGDPHSLRPCNSSINSSRGNKPYGDYSTTGDFGSLGTFYFPGDADKGDIARSLFYSATRYKDSLTLVNGNPGTNQMGDLRALLRWHFTDPPDEFERRRNHLVYSVTNNRLAFVDHPEFVWSVFGGNNNNSTIYLGNNPSADGTTSLTVDLGRIIRGAAPPADRNVTFRKTGTHPTYYAITTQGAAKSSITGRFNAFDYGTQRKTLTAGLQTATSLPGTKTGTITIDNLDVSSGGSGRGSADGNDTINLKLEILDHAQASFSQSTNLDEYTIDFGELASNSGTATQSVSIYNLPSASGLTASLDIDSTSGSGDVQTLSAIIGNNQTIPAGNHVQITAGFDTTVQPGSYESTFVISVSDEDIPGATSGSDLVLTLRGAVKNNPIFPFDDNGNGRLDLQDLTNFLQCLSGPMTDNIDTCTNHDADTDGDVDLADFSIFQTAYGHPND